MAERTEQRAADTEKQFEAPQWSSAVMAERTEAAARDPLAGIARAAMELGRDGREDSASSAASVSTSERRPQWSSAVMAERTLAFEADRWGAELPQWSSAVMAERTPRWRGGCYDRIGAAMELGRDGREDSPSPPTS